MIEQVAKNDVLHTQSTAYIVGYIQEYLKVRGIIMLSAVEAMVWVIVLLAVCELGIIRKY